MKNNMLGQKTLNVTKSYTYLGHIITDNLDSESSLTWVRVKRFSQSECSSTRAAVCPNHVPLGQVPKVETIHTVPSHALNSSLVYTHFLHGVNVKC